MIRLGLRLALGRQGAGRLAVIGGAVAVGVALLLGVLAGINAVQAQNARFAWLNSAVVEAATGPEAADPVWWVARQAYYRGDAIGRIDVAVTGPHGPVPPGLTALPGPGEFYASPALSRLLATSPPAELGDRFPGRQVGLLGADALPSPDSLLIVVGRTPAEVSPLDDARQITRIVSVAPSACAGCYVGVDRAGITLVLGVVAAALLFPLLMFVGTATRLAAARREQRFAAMRLIGATPRQVTVLAAVESTVAAAAGTLLGFALFPLVRLGFAEVAFPGQRFFPADLTLTLPQVLAVVIGVPVAAAVAARLALRRVRVSPLGVTRRVTPKPPRAWRLLPLAAGLAELTWFVGRRPGSTDGQLAAYLGGILLVMAGLVVAGPYLTMLGSRALARWARRPAALIAGRRLADDPRAGFRAVSGLMLALFVTSVATGVIGTIVHERGAHTPGSVPHDTLAMSAFPDELRPGQTGLTAAALPAGLRTTPGVREVQLVRFYPERERGSLPGLISCSDLARTPQFGRCAPGAQVARVFADMVAPDGVPDAWDTAPLTATEAARLPVLSVVVVTDGSPAAVERSRTLLEAAYPDVRPPFTAAEWDADFARTLVQFQRLADVVIVASLLIAGCGLAVAVTAGLNERRRPFSLLRLTGVRLAELRRVVTLEGAVPLLAVSVVAIVAGFLAAHLFLRSQLDYSLHPPGWSYYALVVLGLAASLGLIASTMPLLRRLTSPQTARGE